MSALSRHPNPTASSGVLPKRPDGDYRGSLAPYRSRRRWTYTSILLGGRAFQRGVRGLVGPGHRASPATLWRPPPTFWLEACARGVLPGASRGSGARWSERSRPATRARPISAPKNPGGYCGLGGTGVSCPVGLTSS